jgi:hypothetical protein
MWCIASRFFTQGGMKTFPIIFVSSWRILTSTYGRQQARGYVPEVGDGGVPDWTLGTSLLSLFPYANAPRRNRGDGGV